MVVKKIVKKAEPMMEKRPSVTVETKKVSWNDTTCCGNLKLSSSMWIFGFVLLALNTILLVALVLKPSAKDVEVLKAWWKENFAVMEQIFSLDQFKTQQKAGLEQALSQFKWANAQPQVNLDNATPSTNPEVKATETK